MYQRDLSIIARGSDVFMTRCLDDFGLSAQEVVVLLYLYGHEHPVQKDISDYFMLDKGTVTKTVCKLETKELVERVVSVWDRRKKVLAVTDKGQCVKAVCVELMRMWEETMFAGISLAEAERFGQTLDKVAANVFDCLKQWDTLYGPVDCPSGSGHHK